MESHPRLLRRTLAAWKCVLPALLLFEAAYRVLLALAVKPALRFLADKAFHTPDAALAFNEHILSALLTPLGLLGAACLTALAVLASYYEFSVLLISACCALNGGPVPLRTAMELSVPSLRSLKSWTTLGFAAYALGLLPLADLGVSPALLPSLHIPNFITGELAKTLPGQLLVFAFYAAAFALFALLLPVLPAMSLSGRRFGSALRECPSLLKRMPRSGLGICALFFALWALLFRWPGLVPTHFSGISGAGLPELITNLLAGRLLPALLPFAVCTLIRLALEVFFAVLLVSLYREAGGCVRLEDEALPAITAKVDRTQQAAAAILTRLNIRLRALWDSFRRRPLYQKHKKLLAATAAVALFLLLHTLFAAPPQLHAPIAIGHRGSQEGVENTIQAVQGAIDAGADYAEIDVLLSKDGVPMVIHDANLGRLAGDDRNVYDLTAAELGRIRLSQNGFTGGISTLGEMLDYCKGKIRLVVELKSHGHETADLATRVVETVEEHRAQDDCIFMSIDASLVQALHSLRPRFTIGYCVYGSVVQVDADDLVASGVDFLTIEENMVSPRFVNRCLWAGLPVYVWTVDDPARMEQYLQEGVSGIVSDDPQAARAAVEGRPGDPAQDFFRWQSQWTY